MGSAVVTGLTMRVVAATLVLFLDLFSVGRGEGRGTACRHPKGYDGESYTEGCLKNTCKASTWRTSVDVSLCCYDRQPYQKNTTINSTEDGCVKASIKCVEDDGKAMMIIHTESSCEDPSTGEQVAEIKQLLIEHMDQKGCDRVSHTNSHTNSTQDISTKEAPLMFLGPGLGSNGISEVFSLPTQSSGLTSATCTIPTYPESDKYGTVGVGFVHDGYLQICGGYNGYNGIGSFYEASCYQLKDSAWVATAPLMTGRTFAASVMLQDGSVLVSGGELRTSNLRSSEVLTASALSWSAAIDLPSGRDGHCMLQLTTGQLFLHGGDNNFDGLLVDTYVSKDLMSPWVAKASSQKKRYKPTCVEHAGYVWLGGGEDDATTEKYELSTDSWINGPDLPNYSSRPGVLMSNLGLLTYAGGVDNKNIYQLNPEQNGWIKIGEMAQNRHYFPALTISENICKGVGQVPLPKTERENGQD